MARKETTETKVETKIEKTVETPYTGRNMVTIQLIKDSSIDKYKHPLFVAVNGETFLVQRGVKVDVPDYVAEVIRHSQREDMIAQEKREAQSRKAQEV